MLNRVVCSPSLDISSFLSRRLISRFLFLILAGLPVIVQAQAPTVSYSSPQVHPTGTAISTLSPTSSNVPALTYGNVTTYAGSGSSGGTNTSNPLTSTFNAMKGVTKDALGNFYVAEFTDGRIRKIASNGTVTTLKDWSSFQPNGIDINGSTGDLYISIATHRILRIPNSNSANYPSQEPSYTGWDNDAVIVWLGTNGTGTTDATGTSARFNTPTGLCVDASNTYLYVADYGNDRIRRVTIATGQVETVNNSGTAVTINNPEDVAVDASGNLYVTSLSSGVSHMVRKISFTGGIGTATAADFAGGTTSGYYDGQGTAARFSEPRGIDIDAAGNLYVADGTNTYAIRKITPSGYVSTLAGSGTGIFGSVVNGIGRAARFDSPWDLLVDNQNHLVYIADIDDHRIRKLEIGGYSVWPPLPEGLSMSSTTGAITGTPSRGSRQVYYNDDFDDASGGTNVSIAGHAAYTSGWVLLTDASNSKDGAFKVDASNNNTNGLQVDFTMVMSKTSGGGDGISYSFAPDALTTGGSTVQLGTGTGLSLSFVDNSSNTVKMNLYYGSGRTNSTSVSGTLLASNTSNNALWLGKTTKISLAISDAGKVTVKVEGTTVFTDVQLPAGYLSADKSTWYHVFRAVTGPSSNDIHAIDDLVIRQTAGAQDHTITAYSANGSATATLNINTGSSPTLTSTTATSITATGAASGGNITAEGDASVTAKGVVWSTSANPTVALATKTSDGSGSGVFASTISGLSANTTYYYRAYATNSFGTSYGTESSFTTLQVAPSISYSSSTATLAVGTAANLTLTNSGGTPDVKQVSTLSGGGSSYRDLFNSPAGVASDGSGNLYVADYANHRIRKIVLSTGEVSTLAGSTYGNSDGTGSSAQFAYPRDIAVDGSGNVYVADQSNHRIRKITSGGVVTTLAGSTLGYSEGTGTSAQFYNPAGIELDGSGNLFVADQYNSRIRKITSALVVSTLAGSTLGYNDGPGTSAKFSFPTSIAMDASGNLYVADFNNHRIRKVTSAGVVSTLAGSISGYADGTGTSAKFNFPTGIAVDGSGNVYVSDRNNHLIRKITSAGVVTTLAGSGVAGYADGTGTSAKFNYNNDVSVDVSGNVYVADYSNSNIRMISQYRIDPALPAGLFFDARNGTITGTPTAAQAAKTYTIYAENSGGAVTTQITLSVASAPTVTTKAATSVTATSATLNATVNANGGTTSALTIKYSATQADVDAGNGTSATLSPTSATGNTNTSVSASITGLTAATTYYFRVSATNTSGISNGSTLSFNTSPVAPSISYSGASSPVTLAVGTAMTPLSLSSTGTIEPMQVSTLAGSKAILQGYADGTGSSALFNKPEGVCVDGSGNIFVADTYNHRIRKITSAGLVTTVAGSSQGDANGTGTSAQFSSPSGIEVDGTGNVYVADVNNHRIRKINAAGEVTTLAGSIAGNAEGTGTSAKFNFPYDVAVDVTGNVYVSDASNYRIRKITISGATATVSTQAGLSAQFNVPIGVAVDGSGNVYVTDYWYNRIRKITSVDAVTTLAGSITSGDTDGTGTDAQFKNPWGIAVDGSGNLYVADRYNHRVRKVSPAGAVTTLAGSTYGYTDGTGITAQFREPGGIAVDGSGNLYIADRNNSLIRKISRFSISPALPDGLSFNTATGEITGTPTAITASKTYTVKASNAGGTSNATFTLEVSAPILTSVVSNITPATASSGGDVANTYTNITAVGLVWGTGTEPTVALTTKTNAGTSTGAFSSVMTGLSPNTTYYVRSYVTYNGGSNTDYGSERTFTTNRTVSMADVTKTFGDPAFYLTAPTSNGTGAWTFSSGSTSVATISGNTVTIAGAGTSTITATQAGVSPYAGVSITFQLTVNGQTPTITLGIPTTSQIKDAGGLTITASSNSGGTVTLTLGSGSIAGVTLNPSGSSYALSPVTTTGNLVFEASVPATGNYAAGTLTQTMSVTKNNPTITFNLSASTVTYATGLTQGLTATGGGSSEPVTFSVVSGPGSITGSTLNISGPGDIVIKASQAGDVTHNPAPDVVRTLTVNPAAPTITSFTPTSATEGQTVTITGENFQNVTAVSFGTTAAASFEVVNSTTITAVLGTGHTGVVSVTTNSGTDTEPGFRYKVTWTGATNNFNENSNWTGNRPPQTDDDIIFSPTAASDLELDGSKTVGHVDFNGSGKSLKLGAYNLTVKGNLTMPGNITGSGKVIMQGGSAQTITGGGNIPDLEINNSNGVTIDATGGELTVSGTLRSTSGTLTTNGKLRLTSNSSGTARVGVVSGTITGNVIAERYIKRNDNTDGTGRAWRLVSVPVTGTGDLRDFFMNGRTGQDLTLTASRDAETDNSGTPIVGHNYADASSATAAGFDWIGVANSVSSLRSYVGDATGGSFASENVPDLTTTYAAADQGYMVFARGDRKLDFPNTTSSGSTTFRSTGSLKTGTKLVSVAPATSSKYTLVGNPYMSVLNLDALYTTNSAVINPSFWIWDANISGTNRQGGYVNVYQSGGQWVTNTGTYINPELLESGMAFFVEPVSSLSSATDISILESHKSSASSAGLSPFSTDKPDDHGRMYVRLERADAKGQRHIIDGVMADFHTSHKVTLTDITDREKLRNGISRGALWIPREGKTLSGEGLPWPTEVKRSIPLSMSGVGDQTLLVHINPSGMRDRYVKAWLKDNVLKREVEINMSQPFDYDFIGTGRSDWDSTRFEIVYVEAGRPGTGVTLEPDDAAETPSVKLYPNPSKTAEVKLSLRAVAPGSYTVQVLDMTGRLVATSMLEHRSVNGEYRVLQGRLLAPGQYIVRLINADKQLKETLRMMVE